MNIIQNWDDDGVPEKMRSTISEKFLPKRIGLCDVRIAYIHIIFCRYILIHLLFCLFIKENARREYTDCLLKINNRFHLLIELLLKN